MAGGRISVVMVTWRTGPHLCEAVEAVLAAPDVDEFILVNHENPPEVLAKLRESASANPTTVHYVGEGGRIATAARLPEQSSPDWFLQSTKAFVSAPKQ